MVACVVLGYQDFHNLHNKALVGFWEEPFKSEHAHLAAFLLLPFFLPRIQLRYRAGTPQGDDLETY